MIVIMSTDSTQEHNQAVKERIEGHGLAAHLSEGVDRSVIGVLGSIPPDLKDEMELMPGVREVVVVSKPYKLASREFHPDPTVFRVGDALIGGDQPVIMAGPCTVEDEEQMVTSAKAVKAAGATVMRGGAYKPRTSPYSFRGMGVDGLKLLRLAQEEAGLPVITEVMAPADVDIVAQYADILQVGARNMQNYNLLDEVGQTRKPVMVKRGLSASYEEWLLAAEYVMSHGNSQVMLCERGIRSFEQFTRFTMDVAAIPVIQRLSHLPIIAVVIGEGGSEGALALGLADRILMQQYAVYSPISLNHNLAGLFHAPILDREAAEALMLTAQDCVDLGIADEVVPEPEGGAHNDPRAAELFLQSAILGQLAQLGKTSQSKLLKRRYQKFRRMGESSAYSQEAMTREVELLMSITAGERPVHRSGRGRRHAPAPEPAEAYLLPEEPPGNG